jgi:hypothetical protein
LYLQGGCQAGTLLHASDESTLLKFPAIAEEDATIQIGKDHYHVRRVGDLLRAEREPRRLLEEQHTHMGSDTFQAQFQQEPVPPGGNINKRVCVQRYDQLPVRTWSTRIVQSWDTASKEGGQNDWSVCTTWLFHDREYYLFYVFRNRLNYPALKATDGRRGRMRCEALNRILPTRFLNSTRNYIRLSAVIAGAILWLQANERTHLPGTEQYQGRQASVKD